MKEYSRLLVIAAFVSVVCGCAENQTRVGEGAAIGGILGAAAGEIVGHQSGHDLTGVLIGGAAGAIGGAAVGSQIKKQPASGSTAPASSASAGPLTVQRVVDLTEEGVPTDEIITKIQAASPKYALTS